MKSHPIFVPFGFRDAPENVLRCLGYPPERGKWYHAKNIRVEDALKGILDIIMRTVISITVAKLSITRQAADLGDSEYDADYLT